MRDTKRITLKQRRWLVAYTQSGNATQAAKAAGYRCKNDNGYACVGYQNLTKLQIPVRDLMNGMGLDIGRLLCVLKEGLEAVRGGGRGQNRLMYPDWTVRLRYLLIALRLHGLPSR